MPSIEIDDDTYERLNLVARVNGEPVGTVVRRLLERLSAEAPGPAAREASAPAAWVEMASGDADPTVGNSPAGTMDDGIPIHKIYKGHRVEGHFHPLSHEIRLKTEPWANQYFASPTAAAVKVVDHFSGDVRQTPNTNGRKFWKVTSNGKDLRSIIGER